VEQSRRAEETIDKFDGASGLASIKRSLDGYNYQEMPVDRTIIAWEVMA
jgi:hypothetical protein